MNFCAGHSIEVDDQEIPAGKKEGVHHRGSERETKGGKPKSRNARVALKSFTLKKPRIQWGKNKVCGTVVKDINLSLKGDTVEIRKRKVMICRVTRPAVDAVSQRRGLRGYRQSPQHGSKRAVCLKKMFGVMVQQACR